MRLSFKEKIDDAGGYGKLGEKGSGKGVRVVEGDRQTAETFFGTLAGDRPVEDIGEGRLKGTDSAGNDIVFRPASRGNDPGNPYSGPSTVDVKDDQGRQYKIRFQK